MRTDIVTRLQDTASKGVSVWGDLQMEAAGEIQILRAELANVERAFEAARKRIAELEADAARYRWLRDGCCDKDSAASRIAQNEYGMHWDAAIDAAMTRGSTP